MGFFGLFEETKIDESTETGYYRSLGYTAKQAKRIAALKFESRDIPEFRSSARMMSGMPKRRAVSVANTMDGGAIPMVEIDEEVVMPSPEEIKQLVEDLRWDSYEDFEDARFRDTAVAPTSTFRTTYNTAAATVLLSHYGKTTNIRHSMVRSEELLNFLDYDLKKPREDELFEITPEFKKSDDGKTAKLFIGIAGQTAMPKRQNIVLLIDTSGSMSSKVFQIRATIATVFAKLNDGDLISVVTYSNRDHLFVEAAEKSKKFDIDDLLDKLKEMRIDGCTNGSGGIEEAYRIISKHYIEDGVNRVIMVTDGDLNFGITESSDLKTLIGEKKKTGAFFSAIGTGLYNLQDDKLEALAKNGNGNYFVINNLKDVKKCLLNRYGSLVYPIAVDVKAQVEFNPAVVKAYRLIGYENRQLNHEDFTDDSVIAEPYGSGSTSVALYELMLADGESSKLKLKYSQTIVGESDEICTVSLRYKLPGATESNELSRAVGQDNPATKNTELASECAEYADRLRANVNDREALEKFAELAGYKDK